MNELRIVIDTNVIVSALLFPKSIPRQAFDAALEVGQLLMSLETITELVDVLSRPKFDKYLEESERIDFANSLRHELIFIEDTFEIADCRDPKDNKFLEVAVSRNASDIISGNSDLLILHPYHSIEILTPQAFLEKVHPEELE